MLERLSLKHIDPFDHAEMELAPRLNLITGDNGLGKTLLLDCIFWALAREWPTTWGSHGVVASTDDAVIEWTMRDRGKVLSLGSNYTRRRERWLKPRVVNNAGFEALHAPELGSIVIFQRADGGISIMDPLHSIGSFDGPTTGPLFEDGLPFARGPAFNGWRVLQFAESEIWNGLMIPGHRGPVCRGLINDVATWVFHTVDTSFDYLDQVVQTLVGSEENYKLVRDAQRVYGDDSRDYALVQGPAGVFSSAHAPAGLRRILALAYMVAWAIKENDIHAELKALPRAKRIVLLIDEAESHLHPKWQRTFVPSLFRAFGPQFDIQAVVSTHSPLVLASLESFFDAEQDAWYSLDIVNDRAVLDQQTFIRYGEAGYWLTEAFGLHRSRSVEAERALLEADEFLIGATHDPTVAMEIGEKLRGVLGDTDPFWEQWWYVGREQGWLRPDGQYADRERMAK